MTKGTGKKRRKSDSLQARLDEINAAIQNRQLSNGAKLRLFTSDQDISTVAEAVSGGTEAAERLLIAAASSAVWASTFAQVNRKLNKPIGRPPDYYLFAVTRACCEFWETDQGRALKFSRPVGGGAPSGPLVRLVKAVHDCLLGCERVANEETIADHIKRIRSGNTAPYDLLRNA